MRSEEIKLDRAAPYDEIWGQPGLAFSQNGHVFDGQGNIVTDFGNLKPVDAPEPKPTPEDGSVPRCVIMNEDQKEQDNTLVLEAMHWKTLQKMCGLYGISYSSREQAIAALRGGRSSDKGEKNGLDDR